MRTSVAGVPEWGISLQISRPGHASGGMIRRNEGSGTVGRVDMIAIGGSKEGVVAAPRAENASYFDYPPALVLQALGLQPKQFVAVFACGRVAGWCAHVMEQPAEDRLIRPLSEYIGPRGLKLRQP